MLGTYCSRAFIISVVILRAYLFSGQIDDMFIMLLLKKLSVKIVYLVEDLNYQLEEI